MSVKGVARLLTLTRVYSFRDLDRNVAQALREGMPLEELLRKFRHRIIEQHVKKGNVLLNEGANYFMLALTGATTSPPFDKNNAHIGVGDGSDPPSQDQTGLMGPNTVYKGMMSGYPIVEGNKVTFASSFEPQEANFHWWEWTVANGNSNMAINLNRVVEDLGEKTPDITRIMIVMLSLE